MLYSYEYTWNMKTALQIFLDKHGLTVADVVRMTRLPYMTVRQHALGDRHVSAESALRYERLLGVPRWELRPDLWDQKENR